MTRSIEVRCCCQPRRLLGWLPYSGPLEAGRLVYFRAAPRFSPTTLSLRPGYDPAILEGFDPSIDVALPLAEVRHGFPREGDYRTWLAFKSEETPIAVLRRIPGFVPNEHGEDSDTHGQEESRKDPEPRRPQGGAAQDEEAHGEEVGAATEASAAG